MNIQEVSILARKECAHVQQFEYLIGVGELLVGFHTFILGISLLYFLLFDFFATLMWPRRHISTLKARSD